MPCPAMHRKVMSKLHCPRYVKDKVDIRAVDIHPIKPVGFTTPIGFYWVYPPKNHQKHIPKT